MKKTKLFFYLIVILIFISCKKEEKSFSKVLKFEVRNFYFARKYSSKKTSLLNIKKNKNQFFFIYPNDYNDTLKIINQKMYFRNVLLKKIDSKRIKLNDSSIVVDKYFYKSNDSYADERYFFTNDQIGIIFEESIVYGHMTEYNIKKYNKIHKAIALRQLGFKNGKFELQFPKMNYPDLSMMDSIKEGNRWKYFSKK